MNEPKLPFISNNPARDPNETFEAYRKRIALVRKIEKKWIDGRVFWDSKNKGMAKYVQVKNPVKLKGVV